jgi:solute carrier family 50 protein (sugar transporter)
VLWTKYGLFTADMAIIIVNAFGILTSSLAIIMHFRNFDEEASGKLYDQNEFKLLLTLISLLLLFVAIHLNVLGTEWIALTACGSSVLMYATPLVSLKWIIVNKDPSILSVPLISITFAVCFTWLLYGFKVIDYYVIIPNLMGTLLACLQIALCLWFAPSRTLYKLKHMKNPSNDSAYELVRTSTIV